MENFTRQNSIRVIASFWVVIFLTAMVSPLRAQLTEKGTLVGKITDQTSGEALVGATIQIEGTSQGAAADLDGKYYLESTTIGKKKLIISYIGYQSLIQEVTIVGGINTFNFSLQIDSKVMDEVVVTAQALGQAGAINQQIASSTILNVVSKDKIRELPDQNAAETVGRISGIYVQRDAGEGQKVVVRGLAPRFNNVTVNGLRIPSTDPNDRSVDLSMISPDMLSGIEVYKALRPDQDGDAIGGAVNFQVKKASDEPEIFTTLQYGYNGQDREFGQYKGTLNVSKRFFKDKLGVVATGNYQRANRSSDQLRAEYSVVEQDVFGNSLIEPAELILADISEIRKRYGGSLVLDYKLPNGVISWSNLYGSTERDEVRRRRRYRWSEQRQEFDIRDRIGRTNVLSTALNGEHKLFGKVDFTWQGSFSNSTQNNPDVVEARFREIGAFEPADVNLIGEGTDQLVPLAKNTITDTWLNLISIDSDKIVEEAITLQTDFKIPMRLSEKAKGFFKFGGKYRDNQRVRERDRLVGNYFGKASGELAPFVELFKKEYTLVQSNEGIGISNFLSGPEASNFLDGDFYMGPGSGNTNGPGLNDRQLTSLAKNMRTFGFLVKDFIGDIDDNNTSETVYASYAMTELEFNRKLLILLGLRFERTLTQYRGNFMTTGVDYDDGGAFASVVVDSVGSRNYNEFLPMVHLRYRVNEWFDIRAAVTRSLSRPDFTNLIPFRRINNNDLTIQQANPEIRQIQAWNYDLSASFYNKNGLLAISGFYKRLSDVDYQRTFTRLLPVDDPFLGYTITSPENVDGLTTVFGGEFDLQANFRFLPKPFNGLLLSANLTLINSETFYPFIPDPPRLSTRPFTAFPDLDELRSGRAPRQANVITNVSLGYEVKGFSGRISLVYQGDTFTALGTRSSVDSFQQGNTRVDIALKQKVNSYMKIFLNCNNLTNAAEISFLGVGERRTAEDYYGLTADLGIQFQF